MQEKFSSCTDVTIVCCIYRSETEGKNQRGESLMKNHLQRILSLLCVLALAIGAVSVLAESETAQKETRIITVIWDDANNRDGLRPDSVTATLSGESVTLNEANGWTGEVSVAAGTGNDWTYDSFVDYTPSENFGQVSVLTYTHEAATTISKTGHVDWDDDGYADVTRPASVQLMLLDGTKPVGEPKEAKESTGWDVTWSNLPQNGSYTVKQMQTPKGYTESVSGTTVTNTLQTASLSLNVTVTGAPEGTDLSQLSLTVEGPDPSMPQTVHGSHNFGTVLPGAYLVTGTNAADLAEGYTMDPANTKVADAIYVNPGDSGTLEFKYGYKLPEAIEAEEDYDPTANNGSLSFHILGPGTDLNISYSQFTNGKYELGNLEPGVYTVVETNAEGLVKYYVLTEDSETGKLAIVEPDGTATAKLFDKYVPAPTPEPDAEFVDIPVTKTWNDNNDKDGNRPDSITVRLYADGVEVDSHVLTAAENWAYTFVEKPRYKEDNKTEIVYSINEDGVAMYNKVIKGYNVVNDYTPEVTSKSVAKVWDDNANAQKLRPTSIGMTLSDGQKVVTTVILSDANGWAATVNNLPTIVNGQPAVYSWKEQPVLGYKEGTMTESGGVTTFTNSIWKRPDNPVKGKKPKTPGDVVDIEEYDTPLGVEIIINHVGDCFD